MSRTSHFRPPAHDPQPARCVDAHRRCRACLAADLPSSKAPPALAAYQTWSPWMVRVRGIWVVPDKGHVSINGVGNVAKAKDAIVPELDITYFFTQNIAAELISVSPSMM